MRGGKGAHLLQILLFPLLPRRCESGGPAQSAVCLHWERQGRVHALTAYSMETGASSVHLGPQHLGQFATFCNSLLMDPLGNSTGHFAIQW